MRQDDYALLVVAPLSGHQLEEYSFPYGCFLSLCVLIQNMSSR